MQAREPDAPQPDARELFAGARVARLATVTPGGRPALVPIVFALDGDELHCAVDHKPKRTRNLARLRNIAANPAVSVLVDHYEEDWSRLWWARADGIARVVASPHSIALLTARYEQYARDPPAGPAIVIAVTRWSSWRAS